MSTNNGNGLTRLPDEGQVRLSANVSMPKRERYGWSPLDSMGEYRLVSKTDLHIDVEYQRDAHSDKRVLDIARDFSWRLFEVLSVARRPSGALTVFDGGHRLRAAMKRDDVTVVPCMVFDLAEIKQEAQAFLDRNTTSTAVSAHDKHRAKVVVGDEVAIRARAILAQFGYTPSKASGVPFTTRAIAEVEGQVRANEALATQVIGLCAEIAAGQQMAVSLLRGLFEAARRTPDVLISLNAKKLIAAGQDVLIVQMARSKALAGKGGARIEADAIVQFLNKGRRTQLVGA